MDKNLIKKEVLNFLSKPSGFLLGLLSLIVLAGLIVSGSGNFLLAQKISQIKEGKRPANLEIITIKDSNCKECYEPQPLIENIKKMNVKLVSEKTIESSEQEGKNLIKQFNIEKIPTAIIKGELNKLSELKDLFAALGDIKNDTFILRKTGAPYVNIANGEVKGKVSLFMLKAASCSNCYDVKTHEMILKGFGVYLENIKTVEQFSAEGQQLIKNYNIALVPTIILKGDAGDYLALNNVWSQVGTIEQDGTYIFREGIKQMGVYKDLITGQIITPKTN